MDKIPLKHRVYALGETVLDLVSDGGFAMHAIPGGSMLNASVSLGRMGVDVHLMSEFGDDRAGCLIADFLNENNVQTEYCLRHQGRQTSIALAFLDESKKAAYTFYHDTPEKRDETMIPEFKETDILLFGSFFAVKPDRSTFIQKVLQKALSAKSTIYYDLNIRKAHEGEFENLKDSFLNNISKASIVKGSDEDFLYLFGISDIEKLYEKISPMCRLLIVTNGNKPVEVITPFFRKQYNVPSITPVSTIGAGDNFNAGFIYGLALSGIGSTSIDKISIENMDMITACGVAFATEACLSKENFIKGNF